MHVVMCHYSTLVCLQPEYAERTDQTPHEVWERVAIAVAESGLDGDTTFPDASTLPTRLHRASIIENNQALLSV